MDQSSFVKPTRRGVLRSSAGAAGLAAFGIGAARAAGEFAGKTIVFASWGGSYQDAQKQSYCDPFAAETGARVVQDGPMNAAKFRAMIEGGSPDWDVADVTIEFLHAGVGDRMFEKIDHAVVDVSKIDPKFVHDYGIGCIAWSYNLGYSTKVYAGKEPPKTWTDLYDSKKFPGKRMVADNPVATLETALLADGVTPDKLYPLDVDRALRKLTAIRSDLIISSSNSQSQQLFVDGEVNLGIILNGRAYDAAKKGAPIAVSWEQNIQSVDYLVIPRGSRNVAAAQKLLSVMTVAANQAKLANMIAYAPTNPSAFAAIDPKISPWLSTEPENNRKGFVINAEYWRDNLKPNQERWTAWKLS